MLRFFKRLRFQLVHNYRLHKYFIYAFGEIILVVIGILIALQVNNWNVQRVNKNIESQLLAHLKGEYEQNYNELYKRRNMRITIMKSASWLLEAKDNGMLTENLDSTNHHIAYTTIVPTFNPIRGVTDEIINSGKLQIIRNDSLRVALTTWLSKANDLMGEEAMYADIIYKQYAPYLFKNYNVRPIPNILQNDGDVEDFMDMERPPDFNIGTVDNSENILKLANCEEFENHLSWIMGWNNMLFSITHDYLMRTEHLLELIQE